MPEEAGGSSRATPDYPPQTPELAAQVLDALRFIPDPELGISIVDLGLIYAVEVDGGTVHITYTLTTAGCGIGPVLESQMQEVLTGMNGVEEVIPELVMEPRWTRERMSPEARLLVGDREFHPPSGAGLWERFLPR
jgi:metal-sulfur cluster biosynthetic enzyme